jgi:hypothetical protein
MWLQSSSFIRVGQTLLLIVPPSPFQPPVCYLLSYFPPLASSVPSSTRYSFFPWTRRIVLTGMYSRLKEKFATCTEEP